MVEHSLCVGKVLEPVIVQCTPRKHVNLAGDECVENVVPLTDASSPIVQHSLKALAAERQQYVTSHSKGTETEHLSSKNKNQKSSSTVTNEQMTAPASTVSSAVKLLRFDTPELEMVFAAGDRPTGNLLPLDPDLESVSDFEPDNMIFVIKPSRSIQQLDPGRVQGLSEKNLSTSASRPIVHPSPQCDSSRNDLTCFASVTTDNHVRLHQSKSFTAETKKELNNKHEKKPGKSKAFSKTSAKISGKDASSVSCDQQEDFREYDRRCKMDYNSNVKTVKTKQRQSHFLQRAADSELLRRRDKEAQLLRCGEKILDTEDQKKAARIQQEMNSTMLAKELQSQYEQQVRLDNELRCRQERKDRLMALKLQRLFDSEGEVDRSKGSDNEYKLRKRKARRSFLEPNSKQKRRKK